MNSMFKKIIDLYFAKRLNERLHQDIDGFVGKGIELNGELEFTNIFNFDGKFIGEVKSPGTFFAGENAQIDGNIRVSKMYCAGRIHGTVHASSKTVLQNGAVCTGNIYSNALVVEEGAIFNGVVSMPNTNSICNGGESTEEVVLVEKTLFSLSD